LFGLNNELRAAKRAEVSSNDAKLRLGALEIIELLIDDGIISLVYRDFKIFMYSLLLDQNKASSLSS
jgi:hypothetical protein